MSGGPPHHPSRQVPPTANNAWNHLQVPNYFPSRQPQHAHMSNEHSILHQPTWHTPTTEPIKTLPHSHIFSLEQMLSERQYSRHAPGVDLSLTRNGSGQNGDLPATPISLSVRDANKINSLASSVLEMQNAELNKSVRSANSPGIVKSASPTVEKNSKKRVDLILERLNPSQVAANTANSANNEIEPSSVENVDEKSVATLSKSVIQSTSSHDENSNSSSILNIPRDDEVVSPYSNEDSLDSNKSRRKRKPSKTVRMPKDVECPKIACESSTKVECEKILQENKMPERRRSMDDIQVVPAKTRRKTSSESETIDNIAAMVQEGLKNETIDSEKTPESSEIIQPTTDDNKTIENQIETEKADTTVEAATPPVTEKFVEVENKLEEMFAGIEDVKNQNQSASCSHNNVSSTSGDVKKSQPKKKRKNQSRRNSECETPKKKSKKLKSSPRTKKKKSIINGKQNLNANNKSDNVVKDVYAYDSGSNASSSKSRGPFIQIRGPRDSPLSVSVINTPINDDDLDKKSSKLKKFHDDSEYRHKVRSKGLHCSTLSHQYDAQTKDATWICAFCKRGPHATETSGPSLNPNILAPGDLFGPYIITTNSSEFERKLYDPYDKQFKSKKITKALENVNSNKIVGKKFKRKSISDLRSSAYIETTTDSDIYVGITETVNKTYEIWAHEDCIVWSAGVYLVGPKIVGLEEAVWTSCNVTCAKCHLKGANICCLKRGCVNVMHVCCARMNNWQFNEDSFKVFCNEHKVIM